jgi:hypothetical protein
LDVNEIRKIGSPRQDAFWVNFVTSLAGKQVGRLPYERMDQEVLHDTPTVRRPSNLIEYYAHALQDDPQYSSASI